MLLYWPSQFYSTKLLVMLHKIGAPDPRKWNDITSPRRMCTSCQFVIDQGRCAHLPYSNRLSSHCPPMLHVHSHIWSRLLVYISLLVQLLRLPTTFGASISIPTSHQFLRLFTTSTARVLSKSIKIITLFWFNFCLLPVYYFTTTVSLPTLLYNDSKVWEPGELMICFLVWMWFQPPLRLLHSHARRWNQGPQWVEDISLLAKCWPHKDTPSVYEIWIICTIPRRPLSHQESGTRGSQESLQGPERNL